MKKITHIIISFCLLFVIVGLLFICVLFDAIGLAGIVGGAVIYVAAVKNYSVYVATQTRLEAIENLIAHL